MHLEADGQNVASFDLPAITDAARPGATQRVPIDIPPVTGRSLHLVVDEYRAVDPDGGSAVSAQTLPVSFAEVAIPGVATPASPTTIAGTCRSDLVRVDGTPLPVRVTGAVADARTGLALEACGGAIDLDAGSHTVTTATGLDVGIDVDRMVLSSAVGGTAAAVAPRGAPLDTAGASVKTVDAGNTSNSITVRTDGKPFWLVFGQSHNDGWEASTSGGGVGPHQLVNGYANGWLIRPDHAGTMTVDLTWTPQRLVWVGLAVSSVVVLLCLAIFVIAWRRRRRTRDDDADDDDDDAYDEDRDAPELDLAFTYAGATPLVVNALLTAIGVGVVMAVVSRPSFGAVAALATLIVILVPRARVGVAVVIPLALVVSRVRDQPRYAWLTIAFLVVDLAARWVRGRARPSPQRSPVSPPPASPASSPRSNDP
jgi:hypothetical protein